MEITQTAVVIFGVLLTLIDAKLHKSSGKRIGWGNFIYAIVAGKDQWRNRFAQKQNYRMVSISGLEIILWEVIPIKTIMKEVFQQWE